MIDMVVRSAQIEAIFDDLCEAVSDLELKFLVSHVTNQLSSPVDYELDVKAYCVLCHAAMEEFIERIVIKLLDCLYEDYVYNKTVTDALLMFVHSQCSYTSLYDEKKQTQILIYDYIRTKLDDSKKIFSRVVESNHGFALKYMHEILLPFAIQITSSTLIESLKTLASERGAYAHKTRERNVIRRSINPEDAQNVVFDCLLLCEDILRQARSKIIR